MGAGRMYKGLLACFTGGIDLSLMESTVLMMVFFDGNNRNGRICRILGFGRKSTGGTTLKKTCALKKTRAVEVYREKGRRVSDRWIPSKFPERTRTIRSDRSCEGDIPSGKAKVKS